MVARTPCAAAAPHCAARPLRAARPSSYSSLDMGDSLDIEGLRDRVVLVTGSSRGIGAGIIRAFARNGARCVVNYVANPDGRNHADAAGVAVDTRAPLTVECDVGDYAQVGRMMDQVQQSLGGLDVLVNNAGVLR